MPEGYRRRKRPPLQSCPHCGRSIGRAWRPSACASCGQLALFGELDERGEPKPSRLAQPSEYDPATSPWPEGF
jgi:hypothetical protein